MWMIILLVDDIVQGSPGEVTQEDRLCVRRGSETTKRIGYRSMPTIGETSGKR